MSKILNLTQHTATQDQQNEGVVEPSDKETVKGLLTFHDIPTFNDVLSRAHELADIAEAEISKGEHVMVGGASYLISALENELKEKGLNPVHAFTQREVVEEADSEGNVVKNSVFKHKGFVQT